MNTAQIITVLSSVTIAALGWIIGHILTSRREILQKRREIRIKHLREAYLNLAHISDSGGDIVKHITLLQSSLNDIQLFGGRSQMKLLEQFIDELNESDSAQLNDLIRELRNEIRAHLKLSKIDESRWYVRLEKSQ